MRECLTSVRRILKWQLWWLTVVVMVAEVVSLDGPNVCIVKQKYNITRRVKYRAPMSVRTYEWCFSMPPRCSHWKTEIRDLTRLETDEREAEVSVCCPGYKMKDVACVPICPNGKTGHGCSEDCPPNKWGPNCVNDCVSCNGKGRCSPISGECHCQEGWQGERCEARMTTTSTAAPTTTELLTTKMTTKTTYPPTTVPSTTTTKSTTIETTTSTHTIPTSKSTLKTTSKPPLNILRSTLGYSREDIEIATELSIIETVAKSGTNIALTTPATVFFSSSLSTPRMISNNIYNSTLRVSTLPGISPLNTKVMPFLTTALTTISKNSKTYTPSTSTMMTTKKTTTMEPTTIETTKRPEVTHKTSTTIKFKPKEIWIKPAQKGETTVTETKVKPLHEVPQLKPRTPSRKELTSVTTPKTIIVSIIPTSVSYTTFKKLSLTTASYANTWQKDNVTSKPYNKTTTRGFSPTFSTSKPVTIKVLNKFSSHANSTTMIPSSFRNVTTPVSRRPLDGYTRLPSPVLRNTTNSMSSTQNVTSTKLDISSFLTTAIPSTNKIQLFRDQKIITSTIHPTTSVNASTSTTEKATSPIKNVTVEPRDKATDKSKTKDIKINANITVKNEVMKTNVTKRNITGVSNTKTNSITTVDPVVDEETFPILTEPEHITAVMGDKGTSSSSIDLVSVLSIAGGVMMSVITVAVIIVMIERCKRPRYEDVRKFNDINMQVMIDNHDRPPPPYMRSIFHTPLPDPPTEKCHYQPISTLDRNLKQFMRPVVVQPISPMMLENFREILECHYDHLPRRNNEIGTLQARCSTTPSFNHSGELCCRSVTDSTIEALKCEAQLEVIDNTTSEPLYAEIPCWRPPSEHAVEIVNINGEAVTEL